MIEPGLTTRPPKPISFGWMLIIPELEFIIERLEFIIEVIGLLIRVLCEVFNRCTCASSTTTYLFREFLNLMISYSSYPLILKIVAGFRSGTLAVEPV